MRLTFQGGRVICPATERDEITDCHIAEGKIVGFGKPPTGFVADQTIAIQNQWLLPGLIDLGVRCPQKSTLAQELSAAAKGGITTVCCLPDRAPCLDTPSLVHALIEETAASNKARVCPIGALTHQLAGIQLADLVALQTAGCVAISNAQSPLTDPQILRQCYQYAATFDLLVIIYPEDLRLNPQGVAHEGVVSARLGLPPISQSTETIALVQHLLLIQETGVRAHFANLSCARSVDIFSQSIPAHKKVRATAGVSMHHLWLTEMDVADFNPNCHVHPPLRTDLDRFALREAIRTGIITTISSDHHPLPATAKLAPFGETKPGISGVDTLLSLAHHLSNEIDLPFSTILRAMTQAPADILRQPSGRLEIGTPADLCVYNPQASWTVTPQTLHSSGQNTPFLGWELPGRASMTCVNGKITNIAPH